MSSDEAVASLDALNAAFDQLASLSFDELTHPELLAVLGRLEAVYRRQPVVEHRLIGRLDSPNSLTPGWGHKLYWVRVEATDS
jgi:hypothetical protein